MIKNKEATDSAALEFCHILNKFAAQLDECLSFKGFCLKQSFRASFRRKLGESAICSKYEQNSTASLSVAYLFFIIYQKFNFFYLLLMNTKIISQSPLTYTKSYRRTILPVLFPFILCYNKKD